MDLTVNKNYLLKLRHILPAFALIAWSSVLVLGLIRKVLFLGKYPMLQLDEEIWNFWIPAFFPWAPILLWLKPRFDRLVFRKNNEHRSWQMQLIAWITMSAMLILSQNYLTTATGKMLELENVWEIRKHEHVRYYRIRHFAVYRFIGGMQYAFRKSGRYNQDLHINLYFVNPILTHKNQHLTKTLLYWYGVTFHKQISNWKSNHEKERLFRQFAKECTAKMINYDFKQPAYFENKPASKDRENFRIAVQSALRRPVNDNFIILQPKSDSFESRNSGKIPWIFGSFFIGVAIYMLVLIKPQLEGDLEEQELRPV
jgi:rhomboid protease GluP